MKRLVLILALCLMLTGCVSYYRVTDLNTGKNYFTTAVTRKTSGAVSFKDSRTGSVVTLQTTDVMKITKEEYTYGDPEGEGGEDKD